MNPDSITYHFYFDTQRIHKIIPLFVLLAPRKIPIIRMVYSDITVVVHASYHYKQVAINMKKASCICGRVNVSVCMWGSRITTNNRTIH